MSLHRVSDTLSTRSIVNDGSSAISWSKQGLIAYGVDTYQHQASACNLFFSYLECIDGKNWQLACPTGFKLNTTLESSKVNFKSNKRQPTVKHLEFSSGGWDLFVADENGIISILVTGLKRMEYESSNQSSMLNPMEFTRTSFNSCVLFYSDYSNVTQPDISTPKLKSGNQVISMKWLNLDKVTAFSSPATKIQQSNQNTVLNGAAAKHGAAFDDAKGYFFQYDVQQHKSYGAVHPLPSKQACLALRRNGEVCLLYQEDHGLDYKKTIANLEEGTCDIFKASIGFTRNGTVIIAAYFAGEDQLRFYEIEIDWKFLKTASKIIQEQPNYRVPDDQRTPPSINSKKLLVTPMNSKSQGLRFSDIKILSPTHLSSTKFEVILKFDNIRHSSNEEINTKFLRYNLEDVRVSQSIPKSFKTMASKKGIDITTVSGSIPNLKYIQTISFNELVSSIQLFSMEMHIAFIMANGSFQILDRSNFTLLKNPFHKSISSFDSDLVIPSTIQSFYDAGFEFPVISQQFDSCCISANMCAYVFLPSNSITLHLACMNTDAVHPSFYDGSKHGLLITTAATMALRHTTACYQGYFTDDIVATLRNELENLSLKASEGYSYRVAMCVLQEFHRAINLNIDIPTDQSESMSRSQPLQRLLSLQLSLGTLETWKRNRSGKVAFALINLRFIITAVVYVINTVYQNIQRFSKKGIPDIADNLILREKCILSAVGLIRWCLDYIVMLSQELFEFQNAFRFNNTEQVERFMKESIAVPMIVGKIPRGFLLTAISSIKRLFSFLQKLLEKTDPQLVIQTNPDSPLGAFQKLEEMFLGNDSSILLKTSNAKFSKSYFTQPTLEAYFRIGSMLKNLPISFIAFEKFLAETDVPLRNMKLDSATSLAVEQQVVCQGFVKSSFKDSMKKVCDVFDKLVLQHPETRVSDLFFYDVSWIGLNQALNDDESCINKADRDQYYGLEKYSNEPDEPKINDKRRSNGVISPVTDVKKAKKQFHLLIYANLHDGLLLDSLRKTLKSPGQFMEENERLQSSPIGYDDNKSFKIKKCIRCGSICSFEDDFATVTSIFSFIISPVFQHYQRQCICGGSWADV